MTNVELQSRLKSLSEANRFVSVLTTKLSKLAPSPGGNDPVEPAQQRVELSAEIHQILKDLEEDFEVLKQEAEDLTSASTTTTKRQDSEKDNQRIAVVAQVDRVGEDLKLSRVQFRKAQLQAKRNEDAQKRKEREQLFASVTEDNNGGPSGLGKKRGQEKLTQDEQLVNASNDVTAALRRTHHLMQSELQRSEFAHETLRSSTAALNQLNESYNSLDSLLKSSRGLISTLVTSKKSDTWYLKTACYILAYTIAWLLFRRLFYGPIRYLLYLPIKLILNFFLTIAQVALGLFGGGTASTTALSSSRTPLKIQPSASNRAPTQVMTEPSKVPVGRGGSRKREDNGKDAKGIYEEVGRMTETGQESDTHKPEKADANTQEEVAEPGIEVGDGTKLRERKADEKPNPKKRMMEVPPEERPRDEL